MQISGIARIGLAVTLGVWLAGGLVASTARGIPVVAADGTAAGTEPPGPRAHSEVQIEGGLALPGGDLSSDFLQTAHGLGVGSGYLIGLRFCWFAGDHVVISPSYRFTKYGAFEGPDATGTIFRLTPHTVTYAVDVFYQAPAAASHVRPFVGIGAGVVRNTYTEIAVAAKTRYEAAVDALAVRFSAGVRLREFSLTLAVDLDRFTTPRFQFSDTAIDYDWDAVSIIAGYSLPRF